MSPRDRPHTSENGDRRCSLEAVYVDELTQSDLVTQYEIILLVRQGDVGGMSGIRDLKVESLLRKELTSHQGRDNADDLEQG